MSDWISVYLRRLGAPDTARNRQFLASWQRWEGGHTHNDARFNYLNTTQRMPGSRPIPGNAPGVQAYTSLGQGATAFARTLRNGKYAGLLQGLRSGDPYSDASVRGLSVWLSGGVNPAGLRYAQKVLGTHVKVGAPGPETQRAASGPAALGEPLPPDLTGYALGGLGSIAANHGRFDPMESLYQLTAALASQPQRRALVTEQPKGPEPLQGGAWQKFVRLASGADRSGVHTAAPVKQFVGELGYRLGRPLTITTGTNHNQFVLGTQRQSAHWTGHAADIALSGKALTRAGQQALIVAGMPAKEARKIKGGLFNIGGYQIIFNSNIGGNHYNHLHVGLRR